MRTDDLPPILLASGSPRRRALLTEAGYRVDVVRPDTDETPRRGETPEVLVERLAREKARSVAADPAAIVVAGDTVVVLDGTILGKPQGDAEATRMLSALSGRTHAVLGGWCVRRGARRISGVERTDVRFRALTEAEIEAYVATGEPRDKAGAYGIQGEGGAFVDAVVGARDNVVGLPLDPVAAAIRTLAEPPGDRP